jgi:hypothetical protein
MEDYPWHNGGSIRLFTVLFFKFDAYLLVYARLILYIVKSLFTVTAYEEGGDSDDDEDDADADYEVITTADASFIRSIREK